MLTIEMSFSANKVLLAEINRVKSTLPFFLLLQILSRQLYQNPEIQSSTNNNGRLYFMFLYFPNITFGVLTQI